MTNRSRSIIVTLALIAIVGAAGTLGWNWSQRAHVAQMLNIKKLPSSVREIDCASFGITDVLERCSFEVEPSDFSPLLAGYAFQVPSICGSEKASVCVNSADAGMSHDYCCGPKTGENFHIASTHLATPRDATHGGSLTVLADTSKRQVMVDLYVE